MKLTAIALASALALGSTCAFAHTLRHKSNIRTYPMYSDTAPPAVLHPRYGNPNGKVSGYGSRDMWGHWGAYYGPMIRSRWRSVKALKRFQALQDTWAGDTTPARQAHAHLLGSGPAEFLVRRFDRLVNSCLWTSATRSAAA